jgi:hypothetical protein
MTRIHATCVAIGGRGVLLTGRSGAGKSDLALRLIDRGATLVSDDYTEVRSVAGWLHGSAPEAIAGRIEARGVGILSRPFAPAVPLCLLVDLDGGPERMPEPATVVVCGGELPVVRLAALEASAPIKVEAALDLFGLKP